MIKESNMMPSVCSMCGYYIKYLDKGAIYCDKKANSNCFLSLAEKICALVKEGCIEKENNHEEEQRQNHSKNN